LYSTRSHRSFGPSSPFLSKRPPSTLFSSFRRPSSVGPFSGFPSFLETAVVQNRILVVRFVACGATEPDCGCSRSRHRFGSFRACSGRVLERSHTSQHRRKLSVVVRALLKVEVSSTASFVERICARADLPQKPATF
jgi:hypothetical protein